MCLPAAPVVHCLAPRADKWQTRKPAVTQCISRLFPAGILFATNEKKYKIKGKIQQTIQTASQSNKHLMQTVLRWLWWYWWWWWYHGNGNTRQNSVVTVNDGVWSRVKAHSHRACLRPSTSVDERLRASTDVDTRLRPSTSVAWQT